tara:strand:- start:688 stop:1119 length:432 start_codon:yes stop_codon:yes gene_type:complete
MIDRDTASQAQNVSEIIREKLGLSVNVFEVINYLESGRQSQGSHTWVPINGIIHAIWCRDRQKAYLEGVRDTWNVPRVSEDAAEAVAKEFQRVGIIRFTKSGEKWSFTSGGKKLFWKIYNLAFTSAVASEVLSTLGVDRVEFK